MKRIAHDLIQGSADWHAFRLDHDGASESPAMLGLSRYVTRNELLAQKSSGIAKEVDGGTQSLFDAGHAAEAAARPLAEEIIADELFPVTYSYGHLSASCDGLTMDGSTAFEHKLYRADLAAAVMRRELPDEYMAQCQQIMLVTGAEKVLFVTSDGTDDHWAHMFVEADPAWFARIEAGWKQFHEDLAKYQPVEVLPPAVAAPTMALPAVSIKVEGSIALIDNLKVFGAGLQSFIDRIPEKPSTDQEFADCKAACKTLQQAQDALDAAEAHAMGQVASFDEMRRTKALYFDLARTTRLAVEKLVAVREQQIKVEIRQAGNDAFALHVANLNTRIGKPYLSLPIPDFAGAMKNKRTIASLRDAVDTLLATSKIAANELADRIQINLNTLGELAAGHAFLFADIQTIVTKPNGDFMDTVKVRIAEHKVAEEKRLAAERERIRVEEEAKATAKVKSEADRVAREAREDEEARLRILSNKIAADALAADAVRRLAQQNTVATVGGSRPADESNVGAVVKNDLGRGISAVPTPPTAAPSQRDSMPTAMRTLSGRPDDAEMIKVLARHYDVSGLVVIGWLKTLDLDSAAGRLAA